MIDPQSEGAWKRSQLQWHERQQGEHRVVLDWYQRLIRLRRAHTDFRAGPIHPSCVAYDERARWLRLRRGSKLVLFNFSDHPTGVPLGTRAPFELLLGSVEIAPDKKSAAGEFQLPAWGVAVLALQGELDDMPPLELTEGD